MVVKKFGVDLSGLGREFGFLIHYLENILLLGINTGKIVNNSSGKRKSGIYLIVFIFSNTV
jgi:hypothetical protein